MTEPSGLPILAVGHDASRTGAPVVLLSVLRWITARGLADVHTVLLDGGPLEAEFAAVAPCTVLSTRWSRTIGSLSAGLASVGFRHRLPDPDTRRRLRALPVPRVVLANTLASLEVAIEIAARPGPRPRLVCHVHELDGVALRLLPADPPGRRRRLDAVDHFVAAGRPVADMLVQRMGVPQERVSVVDEFIEPVTPSAADVAEVAARLRAGTDRPVVLDVGAMNRRKGPERFVDLMATVAPHPSAPIGVWLGGGPGGPVWAETIGDVARADLGDALRVLPGVADPAGHVAAADIVVSTAVEDPFPLVVLEAAAARVPVVGFDSGGLAEVLRGAGCEDLVCGLGDLLAMRDRVGALLDDPELRSVTGERLADWVRSTHLVEHQMPRLWEAIAP